MLPSRLDGDAQLGVYHLLSLSRCLENLYKVQQIILNALGGRNSQFLCWRLQSSV